MAKLYQCEIACFQVVLCEWLDQHNWFIVRVCVTFIRVLACVINFDLVGDLALVVVWISLDVVCSSRHLIQWSSQMSASSGVLSLHVHVVHEFKVDRITSDNPILTFAPRLLCLTRATNCGLSPPCSVTVSLTLWFNPCRCLYWA